MDPRNNTAVVLLSGGLDSTVLLYWMKERFSKIHPLYVDYGSSHKLMELSKAQETCKDLELQLHVAQVSIDFLKGSSLTDNTVETPDELKDTINVVVPFRNTMMIVLAAAFADSVGAGVISISPTLEDFAVFRDCRREFIDSLKTTLMLGSKYEQEYDILTPFIHYTKEEVISVGLSLDVDFTKTWSCYNPQDGKACGVCPACIVRKKGFDALNIKDPLLIA